MTTGAVIRLQAPCHVYLAYDSQPMAGGLLLRVVLCTGPYTLPAYAVAIAEAAKASPMLGMSIWSLANSLKNGASRGGMPTASSMSFRIQADAWRAQGAALTPPAPPGTKKQASSSSSSPWIELSLSLQGKQVVVQHAPVDAGSRAIPASAPSGGLTTAAPRQFTGLTDQSASSSLSTEVSNLLRGPGAPPVLSPYQGAINARSSSPRMGMGQAQPQVTGMGAQGGPGGTHAVDRALLMASEVPVMLSLMSPEVRGAPGLQRPHMPMGVPEDGAVPAHALRKCTLASPFLACLPT